MSKVQEMIDNDLGRFALDPLGYVLYNWEWGKGDLADKKPRAWQVKVLKHLGEQVRARGFKRGGSPVEPIRVAIASGHGIGKSALTAWLIMWIGDTRPGSKGVVSAVTGTQLRTKTWAELEKWRSMALTGNRWAYHNSLSNMSFTHKASGHGCTAQTCREENRESFQGLHAETSTPYFIFDEASGIPDGIFEVADGGLTDGEPFMIMFGNPTRNEGRFYDAFNDLSHRYFTMNVDSRDVEGTNKDYYQQLVEDWGEDSDYVRVRVRGMFPKQAATQFISGEVIGLASSRVPAQEQDSAYHVLGVDVARFGDCQSVLYPRIGRDASSWDIRKFRGLSNVELGDEIVKIHNEWYDLGRPFDRILIEGAGVGGGVVDYLTEVIKLPNVFEVQPGGASPNKREYLNNRAHWWDQMRKWLTTGSIPNDAELKKELASIQYQFTAKGQLQMETKEQMMRRGVASPDIGDALAITFGMPVVKGEQSSVHQSIRRKKEERRARVRSSRRYDPIKRMERMSGRSK